MYHAGKGMAWPCEREASGHIPSTVKGQREADGVLIPLDSVLDPRPWDGGSHIKMGLSFHVKVFGNTPAREPRGETPR